MGEIAPDAWLLAGEVLEQAQRVLAPYTLEVHETAWFSVYRVGHTVTDKFDDIADNKVGTRSPRVFIAGDGCHTHTAKAGQGMNMSMQDTFNLGWKLAAVLQGRSPAALLDTYSQERKKIAEDLIETDTRVVADADIARFFLTTRPGVVALVAGGAILLAIATLESACLMAVGLAAAKGISLNAKGALAFGSARALDTTESPRA